MADIDEHLIQIDMRVKEYIWELTSEIAKKQGITEDLKARAQLGGRPTKPGYGTLKKIADLTGVSLDWLSGRTNVMINPMSMGVDDDDE